MDLWSYILLICTYLNTSINNLSNPFLSPPVQVAGWAPMHCFISVCDKKLLDNNLLAVRARLRTSIMVNSLIAYDNGADRITERVIGPTVWAGEAVME